MLDLTGSCEIGQKQLHWTKNRNMLPCVEYRSFFSNWKIWKLCKWAVLNTQDHQNLEYLFIRVDTVPKWEISAFKKETKMSVIEQNMSNIFNQMRVQKKRELKLILKRDLMHNFYLFINNIKNKKNVSDLHVWHIHVFFGTLVDNVFCSVKWYNWLTWCWSFPYAS